MTGSFDVRSFAFYLPQFHPIEQNDRWWGKGFTEWTNVTLARSLFAGHAQPRLPRDLGFYDLRLPQSRAAQAALAKNSGIDGFIYYHYWFQGDRLLEQPFEAVLASGEPDMPFALCWANEDWRRNWDGRSGDVLMPQRYSDDDDREHMRYIANAMRDSRYIRIDGKPLFMMHRVALLPDPLRTTDVWREVAREEGIGEIFLAYSESMERVAGSPGDIGFDAAVEFAPDWQATPGRFNGPTELHDYSDMAAAMLAKPDPGYRRFSGLTPGFDNTPRKGENGYILSDASPSTYQRWVADTVKRDHARHGGDVVLFVNAWNEWAEGAILEPCSVWGNEYAQAHAAGVAEGRGVSEALRPTISFAMVVNSNAEAMMRCLQSALDTCRSLGNVEFVVVDNASTDEVPTVLSMVADEVKSLRNDVAVSVSEAWQQARSLCTSDVITFVSNDIVFQPSWFAEPVQALVDNGDLEAASPSVMSVGNAIASQPLTMTTGVCIVANATNLRDRLPTEVLLTNSEVSLVPTPVVTATTLA